jgi:hypothetical protein
MAGWRRAQPAASEGDVRVVKRMGDPSFDAVVTNPSPSGIAWLNDHFLSDGGLFDLFDDKTSFYKTGWSNRSPGHLSRQQHRHGSSGLILQDSVVTPST